MEMEIWRITKIYTENLGKPQTSHFGMAKQNTFIRQLFFQTEIWILNHESFRKSQKFMKNCGQFFAPKRQLGLFPANWRLATMKAVSHSAPHLPETCTSTRTSRATAARGGMRPSEGACAACPGAPQRANGRAPSLTTKKKWQRFNLRGSRSQLQHAKKMAFTPVPQIASIASQSFWNGAFHT